MIKNLLDTVTLDLDSHGHPQEDKRLNRRVNAINGYVISHVYQEQITKLPEIKDKYHADWKRMYPTYVKACKKLVEDNSTRQAVFFNIAGFDTVMPCFLSFQVLHNQNQEYDLIVYQRSSDISKLEDDVQFFEYVMYKVSKRTSLNVNRLIIQYGSFHKESK